MKKVCVVSGQEFKISEFEMNFLERIAPKFDNKTFDIPLPTLCPDERTRLRTAHRNEQFLYKNKSCFSGKGLISVYASNENIKVCSREEWFSDQWEAMDFGRDFDFSRNFFDQFAELQKEVPRAAVVTVDNENSDYTTGTGYCKNCYLINSSEYCEDCMYGKLLQSCTNVLDCHYTYNSELCYECFSVENCYDCQYVYFSQNCSDCLFCDNCRSCSNCFLCTNLVNQEYCFQNEKLTKEEYKEQLNHFLEDSAHFKQAKQMFDDIRAKRIYKYANIVNCENSTGDFLTNCKHCNTCFDVNESEDCLFVQIGVETKDLVDCSNMYIKPEVSYQVLGTIGTNNVHFCVYVFHSSDLWYCEQCFSCQNCFGCVGLRNKKYCIFNKEYSKEEYQEKVAKIIETMQRTGEWGQFFPVSMSPFGYNESLANEYFTLEKEEALKKGFNWRDPDPKEYRPQTYKIPERITDVPDSICNELLVCEATGKNYKIQKAELEFYRKMNISIPKLCSDERYRQRMSLRNPRELYDRKCSKCGTDIESTFTHTRPEKVYCEKCYLDAIN